MFYVVKKGEVKYEILKFRVKTEPAQVWNCKFENYTTNFKL